MIIRIGLVLILGAVVLVAAMANPCSAAPRNPAWQSNATKFVCPMHPEVSSGSPASCPRCRMKLIPAEADAERGEPAEDPGKTDISRLSFKIPDVLVHDQEGRRLNFYSDLIKGKTVAINFIFTTCTTICPPLTATFRRVQQDLGERAGRDVHLISISVDPVTDVPERLKTFSARFKAGPGWTFVTGNKQEINLLLKALGANVGDKNDHTPMILVGNQSANYWTRAYGLAPASTLVKVITDAATRSGGG
jgi:cytochrome oxidase Cu insertion factor (SCO1/SenC/PrrC family)